MRNVLTPVYNYSDLETNESLKEKVLQKHSDINVDFHWWESIYEDAKEIGLEIRESDIDRRSIDGCLLLSSTETAQNILNNHGESCETYSCAFKFLEEYNPVFSDYLNESSENYESSKLEYQMQNMEESFTEELLECYLVMLRKEYEYLTSEESILDTLQANEYEFYENGAIC